MCDLLAVFLCENNSHVVPIFWFDSELFCGYFLGLVAAIRLYLDAAASVVTNIPIHQNVLLAKCFLVFSFALPVTSFLMQVSQSMVGR